MPGTDTKATPPSGTPTPLTPKSEGIIDAEIRETKIAEVSP